MAEGDTTGHHSQLQIEDGAVIGAGCVIRGKVEKNTVVINKQDIHIKEIQRINE